MTLSTDAILTALRDHAATLGVFEPIASHEAKVSPGSGVACEIFGGTFDLIPAKSGLATASVRLVWRVRLRTNWLQQPLDNVDNRLLKALDTLMASYISSFTLGGLLEAIDILGQAGQAVSGQFGYLDQGDGTKWRTLELQLPMLVDDLWTEAP